MPDYKKIILQHIKTVEEDVKSFKELAKPVSPDNSIGRISRMEAIGEKSVNEASLRKSQKRLQELKKALSRVDTEDYGLCRQCEEEIQEKRLEILPESLICMKCLNKAGQ